MVYVVSDIHGCLDNLLDVLAQAGFNEENDVLYILGDIVDRGPKIWETYQWVKERFGKSVYMILGNHEDMLINDLFSERGKQILKETKKRPRAIKESSEISDLDKRCVEEALNHMGYTMNDYYGTIELLLQQGHTMDEIFDMCVFFDKLPLYIEVEAGGEKYILVHAFFKNNYFNDTKRHRQKIIWERDFFEINDAFLEGYKVVYGHTPVIAYGGECVIEDIIAEDGNSEKINIDCGCVYGGKLALLRLDDKKVFYSETEEGGTG